MGLIRVKNTRESMNGLGHLYQYSDWPVTILSITHLRGSFVVATTNPGSDMAALNDPLGTVVAATNDPILPLFIL